MKVVHGHQGQQYYVLNIVDFATTFQVMAMLDGCSAEECAEKFWRWWVVWAGPPKTRHGHGYLLPCGVPHAR